MNFINITNNKDDQFIYLNACPLCLSKEYKVKYIFSEKESIYLKECSNCNTNYYNKFYNPKHLNKAYQGYNEKAYGKKPFPKLKHIKYFLDILKKNYLYRPKIDKEKLIVDVGCGNGDNIIYYKNKGNEVLGIDIDKKTIKKLNAEGLPAICLDVVKEDIPKKLKNKYDVAFFYFVLEHLSNNNVFAKLSDLLKRKGTLYIAIPNRDSIFSKIFGKYYFAWFFGQHIMFPSKKGMAIVSKKFGFKINKIRYIPDQVELLGSIVFLYKKNITHPEIVLIKSKLIIILSNMFVVPILWLLSTVKIAGDIQYELKKD